LRAIAVGITVDTVEHLAIAAKDELSCLILDRKNKTYQMTAPMLFPGRTFA
jgi:hypothetical protein